MMDKQKQIEEMARTIGECKIFPNCETCNEITGMKGCYNVDASTAIYNKGYRKIPEGAVIVETAVFESPEIKNYRDIITERVRKETAEKISDKVHRKFEPYMQPHTLYSQTEKESFQVFLNKFDEILKEIMEG